MGCVGGGGVGAWVCVRVCVCDYGSLHIPFSFNMRKDIFWKDNKGLSSHHRQPTSYFCSGMTMRFETKGSVDQITLELFNFFFS